MFTASGAMSKTALVIRPSHRIEIGTVSLPAAGMCMPLSLVASIDLLNYLHCVPERKDTELAAVNSDISTDFQTSFTVRLGSQFVVSDH